jgi:hypothetical protein
MPWVEPKLLFPLLNKTNRIILTKGRKKDTLLLPAFLSSSERYTRAVEELRLLLKNKNNRCLVLKKSGKKLFYIFLISKREAHIVLEY